MWLKIYIWLSNLFSFGQGSDLILNQIVNFVLKLLEELINLLLDRLGVLDAILRDVDVVIM